MRRQRHVAECADQRELVRGDLLVRVENAFDPVYRASGAAGILEVHGDPQNVGPSRCVRRCPLALEDEPQPLEEEPHLGGGAQDHQPPRFVPIRACGRVPALEGCGQKELAAVLQAFANGQRRIEELGIGNVHDDGRKDHPVVGACNRGRKVGGQLALEQPTGQLGVQNSRPVPQPGAGLDRVHVHAQLQEPRGIPSASRPYLEDAVTGRKDKTEEVGDTAWDAFVASCRLFGILVVPVDRLTIHVRGPPNDVVPRLRASGKGCGAEVHSG